MAHHKRRSRRRDKLSYYPCGCCVREERRSPDLDDSEICNGKPRSKRKRPKKDKCPVNRTHEWYREEKIETQPLFRWGVEYAWLPRGTVTRRYKVKTCIHCFVEKKTLVREPWDSDWRKRKKIIPKRPVKLY